MEKQEHRKLKRDEVPDVKEMTKEQAERIYAQIARQHGTNVDEVKKEIKLAMMVGMCSQDPTVQKKWESIPHDGEVPTPEELLIFLTSQLYK
jgi:hypothetical protein